ncbi:MAG: type III-E CRISPR-associated TPR-CHAT protein Csx29 [Desulfococcaceae bacterium]|nr:type III-E CRISPR-associated TPR-CHAT protein Csx29 [Desulfococcaceae bacterium]
MKKLPESEHIDNLQKALKKYMKSDEESSGYELSSALHRFEHSLAEPQWAICQKGFSNAPNVLDTLCLFRSLDTGDYLAATADFWLKEYEACKDMQTHRQRREKLEEIIAFLQPFAKKQENTDILIQLAKAYFHRSLLYRPKGYSVPPRKTDAMIKAKNLSEKVLKKDEENRDALRIWLHTLLFLQEIKVKDYDSDMLSTHLENVVLGIMEDGISEPDDMRLLIQYAQTKDDFSVLETIREEKRDWGRPFDLHLSKAWAYFLLDHPEKCRIHAVKSLGNAPAALSDPFWDDLISFIRELRKKNSELWHETAIRAHEKCCEKEANVGNNIYLNWYWSRQRELYDLAFMAQENPADKAVIADSLKSRPILRFETLNDLRNQIQGKNRKNHKLEKQLQQIIEQENEARDGRYMKKNPSVFDGMKREPLPFDKLPAPWIAIHFYLNELETFEGKQGGHALIYEAKEDEGHKWQEKTFDYTRLYEKFLEWQENYISDNENAAPYLVNMCKEMGNAMPFLFDRNVIPENRPVLLIPHGFMHKIPIHAAIKTDTKEVFLETHASRYLPAWHMFSDISQQKGVSVLLKKFDEASFDELEDRGWDEKQELANPVHLEEAMQKSPELLLLLCHGEGSIQNPFRSHLLLESGNMSILDLLITKSNMAGTRVLLGACESDMAPPSAHSVDEHLSLSTVFLSHKAGEVAGGLWKIESDKVDECYTELCESNELAETLKDWQDDFIKEWRDTDDDIEFYYCTPFRITGFPL